jgi:hypothetical protein
MTKLGFAQVLATLALSTVLGALPACIGESSPVSPDGAQAEATTGISDDALEGKWQFVYDDAIRSRVETQLAAKIQDPAKLADAKRAAAAEADASFMEFTEEGELISWVEGAVHFRAPYRVVETGSEGLVLAMTKDGREKTTSVAVRDDRIVISDPEKGPLTFRRVR